MGRSQLDLTQVGQFINSTRTEQIVFHFSNGQLDETNEPDLKLKADGGKARRAESTKRNKWLRDKGTVFINIGGGTEEKMVGSRKNIGGSRLG